MKNHQKILFLALLPFFTFILSCRKDKLQEESIVYSKGKNGKQLTSFKEKQLIKDWLVAHDVRNNNDKQTLELVGNNLNYDEITIETRDNGEDIIIIPIKGNIKEYLNLNAKYLKLEENSILNLMIVRSKVGKLRWSSIVSYLPTDGKRHTILSQGTLQNILNNKPVADEGVFKFIDLKGRLQQQMGYKNGKLSSWSTTTNREEVEKLIAKQAKRKVSPTVKKSNQPTLKNAQLPEDCVDFFLVTTYYDGEGGTYEEWDYLYTECDGETGGGGGGTPEEPEDLEVETEEGFTVYPVDNSENGMYTTSGPSFGEPAMPVVRLKADVRRYSRFGIRYISSVTMQRPYLEGITNVAYGHPTKGPVTRNIAIVIPLPPFKLIDPARQVASISWFWELNYRYSFLNGTESFQTEHSKHAVVNAYTTSSIEFEF
ncbi:MAG TPA: hypothetical protein VL088_10180 [Pedobacter sp.]|nr:hypothetical protein [Pedobacter sp.]